MKRLAATLCLTIAVFLGSAGVGYALPECAGSPTIISNYKEIAAWSGCFGSITFGVSGGQRAGNKYTGEFTNGMLHGQGNYTFANGAKHIGGFRDGQPHGQGTITFPNGDKYVGPFIDGKKIGQGAYSFANGDKYVGEFKGDRMHGEGTYVFQGGKILTGMFKDGNFWREK